VLVFRDRARIRHRRFTHLYFQGLALLTLLSTFILFSFANALDVPPLRGRVNDTANLMPPARAQALEQRLEQFENDTGHQIAVLTIPSLQGEDIAGFGIRVAENWKIGKKKFDNGAILIVARDDHRLRIEVGYGLEGVLPDAIANRIIQEIIVPRFRDKDFPGGIEAGVEAIQRVVSGERLPEDKQPPTTRAPDGLLAVLFFLSVLFAPFAVRSWIVPRSRRHGATVGGVIGGGIVALTGGLSFLLGAHLPLGLVIFVSFTAVAAGMVAGLQGSLDAARIFGRRRSVGWGEPFYSDLAFRNPAEFHRGSGRSDAGFGSGTGDSYAGGSGGGGGFSGGGGGFGGGGASGSW
jgi:uncharacterized protein